MPWQHHFHTIPLFKFYYSIILFDLVGSKRAVNGNGAMTLMLDHRSTTTSETGYLALSNGQIVMYIHNHLALPYKMRFKWLQSKLKSTARSNNTLAKLEWKLIPRAYLTYSFQRPFQFPVVINRARLCTDRMTAWSVWRGSCCSLACHHACWETCSCRRHALRQSRGYGWSIGLGTGDEGWDWSPTVRHGSPWNFWSGHVGLYSIWGCCLVVVCWNI